MSSSVSLRAPEKFASPRWVTFLPGFPDGSYGFSRVNDLLGEEVTPRLFAEYLGQGDSDKPAHHKYSTTERADLIEAQWANHRIERTTIVTFDYSSLVLMELLARQQERIAAGQPIAPRIDAVLIVNGGLFADAHSHPWHATPLIKSVLGGPAMWAAQRSERIFGQVIGSANMFSKEYGVTRDEIHEQYSAITGRAGAAFLHRAAGFVAEHKANTDRWNLRRLYRPLRDSTTFVVAGSEADPHEHKQIDAARERLGSQGLRVRMFPGGHMTTSEHPDLLANEIVEVVRAAS